MSETLHIVRQPDGVLDFGFSNPPIGDIMAALQVSEEERDVLRIAQLVRMNLAEWISAAEAGKNEERDRCMFLLRCAVT